VLLSSAQLSLVHTAAVTADLDRSSLLAHLDRRFVASLPRASTQAAQLLQDLSHLNGIAALQDGTVPLRTWLENAVLMAGPRPEGGVFEDALRGLSGAGGDVPPAGDLLDAVPYPWGRTEAVRLRDLLVNAYPEVGQVQHLAKTAPIQLGRWTREGGIEAAWNSLLDLAASQQKLRALIARVLADPTVSAHHAGIRRCFETSTRERGMHLQ
jgi:hypothetical protein